MAFHISAHWAGQSQAIREKQSNASGSPLYGRFGYLWDRWPGNVTYYFVREAFLDGAAAIAASFLRERLPDTLERAEYNYRKHGSDQAMIEEVCRRLTAFVELYERMEKRQGRPVMIVAWTY
jgi:hypothetical protein